MNEAVLDELREINAKLEALLDLLREHFDREVVITTLEELDSPFTYKEEQSHV